jgi:hypothetical protein
MALQDFVRSVDTACIEVEQSRELSPGAIARRRAEVCDQALRKLVNFSAFEIAENALSENIVALERLSNRDPEQVQMLRKLTQALHDLPEGIDATRRMLLERCKNARRAGYDQFGFNQSPVEWQKGNVAPADISTTRLNVR